MKMRHFVHSSLVLLNFLALPLELAASRSLLDECDSRKQMHEHSHAACSYSSTDSDSYIFFSSEYFDSRGWFSHEAVSWLDTLSHEDKVSRLADVNPLDLLEIPLIPATSHLSAIVSDGLDVIADYLSPFSDLPFDRSNAKRDNENISTSPSKNKEVKIKASKTKRQRVRQLRKMSKALRGHVEEVLPELPAYRVSSLSSFNTLLRSSRDVSIPKVDMRAPRLQQLSNRSSWMDCLTPSTWGDDYVESLMPAISSGRFKHINLSGNQLSTRLFLRINWNGLETLDLKANNITQFGGLLRSGISHIDLSSNPIYALFEDQIPESPNESLRFLNVENTKLSNFSMGNLLSIIHLFPNLKILKIGSSQKDYFDGVELNRALDISHPSLEFLGLSGWKLEAKSIAHVLKLPRLQTLDIRDAHIGAQGLAALRKGVKIMVSPELTLNSLHTFDLLNAKDRGVEIEISSE